MIETVGTHTLEPIYLHVCLPETETPTVAHLYGKSEGILCGVPFFDGAFVAAACTQFWPYIAL